MKKEVKKDKKKKNKYVQEKEEEKRGRKKNEEKEKEEEAEEQKGWAFLRQKEEKQGKNVFQTPRVGRIMIDKRFL